RWFVEVGTVAADLRPLTGYAVELSAAVPDADWDARAALNAWLLGADRGRFEAEQRAWLAARVWGPEPRSEAARARPLARRLAALDAVAADPAAARARFAVRYLALPAGAPAGHLGPGWARLQAGPTWQLWEFRP